MSPQIGRLAMRQEGDWWVAYFAQMDTMVGAIELGRVHMFIASNPALKTPAMELFKCVVGSMIGEVTGGAAVSWPTPPEPAPEHERSGTA